MSVNERPQSSNGRCDTADKRHDDRFAEYGLSADGRATDLPRQRNWTFSPIGSDTFACTDYRPTWLIEGALVAKQPAIFGGQTKSLKTSIAVDMALSLGSGHPFLGTFRIYRRLPVAVLSGESGPWALQEVANRICAARRISLASVDVLWQFSLPQLGNLLDLGELTAGLQRHGVEVVLIDPLYLCLLAGLSGVDASNVYQTGPLLMTAADACLAVGCTPIFLHHSTKRLTKPNEPMELSDLAYSGVGEFARQWMLLSRRDRGARARYPGPRQPSHELDQSGAGHRRSDPPPAPDPAAARSHSSSAASADRLDAGLAQAATVVARALPRDDRPLRNRSSRCRVLSRNPSERRSVSVPFHPRTAVPRRRHRLTLRALRTSALPRDL
jgi:AAA domain-containing protein